MLHSLSFLIPLLISLLASESSNLPQIAPRIFISSPWVPTSISRNLLFPLIPTALVRNSHLFLPKLLPAVSSMAMPGRGIKSGWKGMLGMSGFDVSSDSPTARRKLREDSQRSLPTADIHPPFDSQLAAKLRSPSMIQWITENVTRSVGSEPAQDFGTSLLFKYLLVEGMWGISQEHLLCLGRAKDGGMTRLTERLVSGWEEVGRLWNERKKMVDSGDTVSDSLTVVLYWANGDGMIPLKGRAWLDNLISSQCGLDLVRHELGATSGHDTPLDTKEVVEDIFGWVKANGMYMQRNVRE